MSIPASGLVENAFAGKAVIVTGAASGIGRASAVLFARGGASVAVADIDDDGGKETVGMIAEEGGTAIFVHTDVSRAQDVDGLVRTTVATFGRLDCAHNNAGAAAPPSPFVDVAEADWSRIIDINLKGVWLCLKEEIRHMLAAGHGGAIVNTTSARGAHRGLPFVGAYVAAKHGVLGLSASAAVEYVGQGIRVNCVAPGLTRTPLLGSQAERAEALLAQQPGGRMAEPHEVATAAVWLCSDAAQFVSGVTVPVDLTWTA